MTLPVAGFRHWRLDHDLVPRPVAMRSRAARDTWADLSDVVRATCRHGHRAPDETCLCGLHAFAQPEPMHSSSPFMVEGIIAAAGEIRVHEHRGFRAEQARVVAFLCDDLEREPWLVRLSAKTGVPLVPHRAAWDVALEHGDALPGVRTLV